MAAKSEAIELSITNADILSIQNAYRYTLAGLPTSALRVSADSHNHKLAHLLARFIFQKYLRDTQTPFSTIQNTGGDDPVGKLTIGGRNTRFFIRFVADHNRTAELTLTKPQVEVLTDADDINIFANYLRPARSQAEHTGLYYFLPPLPEADQNKGVRWFIQASGTPIKIVGLDHYHSPLEAEIRSANSDPVPVPPEFNKLAYLFCPFRPKKAVTISAPSSSYLQITPADWLVLGFSADLMVLTGWIPSFQLKSMVHDRLALDTIFRIRYFRTEKCSLSPADLRSLPRLLSLAKQLDKGA